MEQQQLVTMLSIEKTFYFHKTLSTHPKRKYIADTLNKLKDDEKISDDVFALTMNIFDRFISKTSLLIDNRSNSLLALSCYNLAKKLRTNVLINNENEVTSLILANENFTDDDIFNTEQIIAETLDWDLSSVVPHDYIRLILQYIFPRDFDLTKIVSHIHILLSIAICEINTLTILPSLLCCACIRAALKGIHYSNIQQIDDLIIKRISCNKSELIQTQCLIEQFLQTCLKNLTPKPTRRCLAPIETINTTASPRVK